MCYDPCFHQGINSLLYSYIYLAINFLVFKVIIFYNCLGNELDFHIVILGILHWIFQVEVPDIYNKLFSVWGGEYAVPVDFGRG